MVCWHVVHAQLWLKASLYSAIYQINGNPPKLPSFHNVSVKVYVQIGSKTAET